MTSWCVREITIAAALIGSAASAGPRGGGARLLPLSSDQVTAAGAAGTGCSWSRSGDRRTRFAAADDRAVVRLANGIVALRPADGAADLFTTYDRWIGGGVAVVVRPRGPTRNSGESAMRRATLSVKVADDTIAIDGNLGCGS